MKIRSRNEPTLLRPRCFSG